MESIQVEALVVQKLNVVCADVLIGAHLVAMAGGLELSYNEDGVLYGVCLGKQKPDTDVAAASAAKISRHISTTNVGEDVVLEADAFCVEWSNTKRPWELMWHWKDGAPPIRLVLDSICAINLHINKKQFLCRGWKLDQWMVGSF